MALNAVMGGKQNNKPSSGLGGLASSFLGGQGSHTGNTGGSSGSGGLAGQLVGSLLGGGKPHNQQQSSHSSGSFGSSGTSSSAQHQGGGLMGMASNFLGGHHGSSVSLISPR